MHDGHRIGTVRLERLTCMTTESNLRPPGQLSRRYHANDQAVDGHSRSRGGELEQYTDASDPNWLWCSQLE